MAKFERTNEDGSKVIYDIDKAKKEVTITFSDGSKKTYKASKTDDFTGVEYKKV